MPHEVLPSVSLIHVLSPLWCPLWSVIEQMCSKLESICFFIISSVMHAFWLVFTYDLLEDRRVDDVITKIFLILYCIKQIDSKLPCVCSVIDHRGHQNVVRTSVTHLAAPRVPLFCSYNVWHHLWSITEQTHGNLE